MKNLTVIVLLSVFSLNVFSQNTDIRKKIEVNGSAEAEVTPDIIYIGMSLKEYFRDSNNKKKVEIEELELQLQSAVLKAGIPQENFTINNISSYNSWWEKKKSPDFLAPSASIFSVAQVGPKVAFSNFSSQFSNAQFIWSSNLILDNLVLLRFDAN